MLNLQMLMLLGQLVTWNIQRTMTQISLGSFYMMIIIVIENVVWVDGRCQYDYGTFWARYRIQHYV